MNGPDAPNGQDPQEPDGSSGLPRVPPPRTAAEDGAWPPDPAALPPPRPENPGPAAPRSGGPVPPDAAPPRLAPLNAGPVPHGYSHGLLKSLLGAWALAACSAEETAAVEAHLTDCTGCADEALRLRDAVGLLHPEDGLDLDPMLRSEVLEGCLSRRPARIPVPEWATPYDAETARLDALLHDLAEVEWRAPVRLRWFDGLRHAERTTTVGGVLGHLSVVDGTVAATLGLPDPLHPEALRADARPSARTDPTARTEASWRTEPAARRARGQWRDQRHALIRTVSFGGDRTPGLPVPYGDFSLPMRDAFLDRAFECWVHAGDIADAIDYPYGPPAAPHLWRMLDLAARLLPVSLAARRRAGLASPARTLGAAGAPGRSLHLEVEGPGGGDWYVPLDSPGATGSPEHAVAHVALDGLEFCQLAAGHVAPEEAAAGHDGDREAVRDVLFAAASLSRM
ncbi:MDMPI N domain containing protein [Streptomyces sp. RKND-216]|uniref:zf-HC2 domain-containing protein n=1 Tax=Streptomyces sp. RKND-216 TaxID=2562581 RepID=UPI00109E2146|nr:zf-HC2 domain-containing protein [Streptomyces sp. RKND-216]THA25879.1 MDMPI N domain containing protein [Streptomyces sp. RKND-216]